MKRILTLLGTVLLCLTSIILPAKAATIASGTCGDSLTWTLADTGTLTISGTGEMYDFYYDNGVWTNPWMSYAGDIKKVLIKQGVTGIGEWAFGYCRNLFSITLPESVTSIGDRAFYDCSSLISITLLEGVMSIGEDAFYNCSSLTSIILPESLTSIRDWAFYNCSTLTSITIPEGVAFPDIKDALNLFGDDRQSHRAAGDFLYLTAKQKGDLDSREQIKAKREVDNVVDGHYDYQQKRGFSIRR